MLWARAQLSLRLHSAGRGIDQSEDLIRGTGAGHTAEKPLFKLRWRCSRRISTAKPGTPIFAVERDRLGAPVRQMPTNVCISRNFRIPLGGSFHKPGRATSLPPDRKGRPRSRVSRWGRTWPRGVQLPPTLFLTQARAFDVLDAAGARRIV